MKIELWYSTEYAPFHWVLNVSNGIGIQVDFNVKPTHKQIKNVVKAVRNVTAKDFRKKYSIKASKIV